MMLSQLNYKAAAYLNGGAAPDRQPLGRAHVLRARAAVRDGVRAPRAVRHPRRVLATAVRGDRSSANGPTTRGSRRCTRGSSTATSCSTGSARGSERRRRRSGRSGCARSGIPVGAVADLGDALDGDLARSRGMVVSVDTADGPLRLVGNPIHVDGGATSTAVRRACTSTPTSSCPSPASDRRRIPVRSGVVVDDDLGRSWGSPGRSAPSRRRPPRA